jgi:midasin
MNRIRGFASNSPLARFNTGLQILRKKVDEWNSVAHRNNNFKDIDVEIAELIQKWMRLELQCWRESLNQSLEMIRSKAYRYWFFLYNLVHEYLSPDVDGEKESSLVDFNDVEKRFTSDEIIEEKPTAGKISIAAITRVLKQFIESSSYAEFSVRMKLLKSFESYLIKSDIAENSTNRSQLISIMHNLHLYFSQFSQQVQDKIDFVRKPVEKKLKEFVKIESFNKNLSYFSMRSNIQGVHHNLHKILKEFELEVMKKMNELFLYKDSAGEFHEFKTSPNSWKPTELNIASFIATQDLETTDTVDDSSEILQRINKFFKTSQKIVRESIENALYPSLIESFQEMMERELETCLHLRSLEVDREKPRNKQKSQAKHILSQKRKALTDFFKSLTLMGISYKTGLLTNSLHSELTDLQLTPFSIDAVTCKDFHLRNSILVVSKNLDLYFNKSVLKMKLLTNALLMPRPDMDHGFLERIKGFAFDLFVMVQDQRKVLAANVNEMETLKKFIKDIETISGADESSSINFEAEFKKLKIVQEGFVDAIEIMEQFKILMKCSPEDAEVQHKAIISTNNTFTQKSHLYSKIVEMSDEILSEIKHYLKNSTKKDSRFNTSVSEQIQQFTAIITKCSKLKEYFAVDRDFSVYGKPICDLHETMLKMKSDIDAIKVTDETPVIDDELDKLAHSILIAMQNIYKKFKDPLKVEKDESSDLVMNHLKAKMHHELAQDITALNLGKVNSMLCKILNSTFSATNSRVNRQLKSLSPLVRKFELLTDYFFIQQLSAHKLSTKMLSIMLSVFLELATKGFCVPQDLLSDEEQKEENDTKTGDRFGFEDSDGKKDVSDKLEFEDQLDEAKELEDNKKLTEEPEKNCKEEEKGVDMSDDFEGKMQDVREGKNCLKHCANIIFKF